MDSFKQTDTRDGGRGDSPRGPTRIALHGACGKMGRRIGLLALEDQQFKIASAIESSESEFLGHDFGSIIGKGSLNIPVEPAGADPLRFVDAIIDFSTPAATVVLVIEAARLKKGVVIGVTGLSQNEIDSITKAAASIPVVLSPNMSVGVNLLFDMVRTASFVLGPEYNARVSETHHVHKKDSPSGTAKEIVRIINEVRQSGDIPVEATREGEVVGDHAVIFESPFDTIEVKHSAKTRDIFAKGALMAAKFVATAKPGLYAMRDVLNI